MKLTKYTISKRLPAGFYFTRTGQIQTKEKDVLQCFTNSNG
jgi:hypothetical protein